MKHQTSNPFHGQNGRLTPGSSQADKARISPRRLALLFTILASLACNLSGQPLGQTPSTPNPGTTQPATPQVGVTPSGKAPAPADMSDVKAIARQVYSQVQAGQDLTPLLGSVFEGLGIPVLRASTDGKSGMAMLKAGKPAVFDVQLQLLQRGYQNAMAVTLDSFLADLTAHGVAAANPPGPLTSAYLKTAMTGLVGKTSYSPQETLPALVIALGQERAKRLGVTAIDPVWGDGWLDPLQDALLTYGFGFPGIRSAAATGLANLTAQVSLIAWMKAGPDQQLPGFFDNLLKNLNQLNIQDFLICGGYYINNTQIIMAGPTSVYHKQSDVTDPPPYQATVTGSVFISAPSSQQRDLLTLAGCKTPPNSGPFPDRTVAWTLDTVAQQHGSFTKTDAKTQGDGTVTAIYQAIDETVPQAGRIPPAMQKAVGQIQAEVLDLVPDHPQLEAAGRLAGGGKTGWIPLEIRFYSNLALDIGGSYQLSSRDTTITHIVDQQTIPLTGNNGTLQGAGSLKVSSSAPLNCGSGGMVQGKGTYTGKIQVFATPGTGAHPDQLSFKFAPDMSMFNPPVMNVQCVSGDLTFEAWGGLVTVLTAKFTLDSSTLTYAFTPPTATGTINFRLHVVKP
jgi:hypothetical protein